MTVLSNIITPSNVLTTTNTATVTNKTLTSPTVTGMTVSDGTANGVTYLNGSKVLTSGSALTFDGTNLAVGTTSPLNSLVVTKTSRAGFEVSPEDATNVSLYSYNRNTSAWTNLLYYASNQIFCANGTTEGMRLTSTGLGIGTSSPEANAKLTVKGAGIAVSKDSSTVTPSGFDLKCRSANPQIGLHVTGTAQLAQIEFGTAGDNSFGALINVTGADPLRFGTNNTERARITSTGNLLVGTTSAGFSNSNAITIQAAEGYCVLNHANGTGSGTNYIWFGYNAGSIGTISQNGTTAVAYNTTSDYRLKNTVAPMTGALDKVAQLKPVTYKWNADGSDGQGFIAHELAAVCPDAVCGAKDAVDADGNPQYQGIDTSFLVATLTAAIQEQQALIQSLKARLDAANL